ncbi:unnamed protein product [Trichobilharzia regenti]|nr:unnamed protein product [Trichobilharzia regenti]
MEADVERQQKRHADLQREYGRLIRIREEREADAFLASNMDLIGDSEMSTTTTTTNNGGVGGGSEANHSDSTSSSKMVNGGSGTTRKWIAVTQVEDVNNPDHSMRMMIDEDGEGEEDEEEEQTTNTVIQVLFIVGTNPNDFHIIIHMCVKLGHCGGGGGGGGGGSGMYNSILISNELLSRFGRIILKYLGAE